MTLKEKAKEVFGEDYVKQCPAEVFGIGCFADNDFPICHDESCWNWHNTDRIEYRDNPKEMLSQQIIGRIG